MYISSTDCSLFLCLTSEVLNPHTVITEHRRQTIYMKLDSDANNFQVLASSGSSADLAGSLGHNGAGLEEGHVPVSGHNPDCCGR